MIYSSDIFGTQPDVSRFEQESFDLQRDFSESNQSFVAGAKYARSSQFFLFPTKLFGVRPKYSGAVRFFVKHDQFLGLARMLLSPGRFFGFLPHFSGSGKIFLYLWQTFWNLTPRVFPNFLKTAQIFILNCYMSTFSKQIFVQTDESSSGHTKLFCVQPTGSSPRFLMASPDLFDLVRRTKLGPPNRRKTTLQKSYTPFRLDASAFFLLFLYL